MTSWDMGAAETDEHGYGEEARRRADEGDDPDDPPVHPECSRGINGAFARRLHWLLDFARSKVHRTYV